MKIKLDSPSLSSQPWCNSDLMNQRLYSAHGWRTNCQNLVGEITSSYLCLLAVCHLWQKKGTLPLFHVTATTTDHFVCATQKAGKAKNKVLMIWQLTHLKATRVQRMWWGTRRQCVEFLEHLSVFTHWALPLTHELLMEVKTTKCFNNKWSIHVSFLMLNHILLIRF